MPASRSALLRSAATFAHLMGRGAPKPSKAPAKAGAKAAEEEKDEEKKGRRARSEGDDGKPDGDDKDMRRAEGDEDEEPEADDEDETEEEKQKRREEEDEQDEERREDDENDKEDRRDEEDKKDAKATAARKRERARCRAIFSSAAAGQRPDMAAHLAFRTDMSRTEAVRTLAAVVDGQPRPSGFAARMSGMETIRPGASGGGDQSPKQAAASSWDRSAKRLGLKSSR